MNAPSITYEQAIALAVQSHAKAIMEEEAAMAGKRTEERIKLAIPKLLKLIKTDFARIEGGFGVELSVRFLEGQP